MRALIVLVLVILLACDGCETGTHHSDAELKKIHDRPNPYYFEEHWK